MVLLPNGTVTITRITSNNKSVTVLIDAPASLQGDNTGIPLSSPWYQPSMDAELGSNMFANWSIIIGGPDENPDYEPMPGDRIVFTPDNPVSKRAGIYKQVSDNTGEEDDSGGMAYWELPSCKVRSGS